MNRLVICTLRESYGKDDVRTMSVRDLIDVLSEYDEDTPVVLSFDSGYTYGGIRYEMIEEENDEEDV